MLINLGLIIAVSIWTKLYSLISIGLYNNLIIIFISKYIYQKLGRLEEMKKRWNSLFRREKKNITKT